MKTKNIPSPCIVTRYDASGSVSSQETIKEPPIRRMPSLWEPDVVVHRYRVMCLQETGEEQFVGNARNMNDAMSLERLHKMSHPEHHSFFVERLNGCGNATFAEAHLD